MPPVRPVLLSAAKVMAPVPCFQRLKLPERAPSVRLADGPTSKIVFWTVVDSVVAPKVTPAVPEVTLEPALMLSYPPMPVIAPSA